ncbi:MAG: amidohydrolase family protein, partial [Candidatus Korarchaeota archaeon]
MIMLKDAEGKTRLFYIFDAHHHIGRDVDGHTNNPSSPGGSFDFIKRTGTMLLSKLSSEKISFTLHPAIQNILDKHSEWKSMIGATESIDQFVAFPFQDVFRKKPEDTRGEYWRSNENIARWSTRAPYSFKVVGYGRVNPREGDLAINELKYAISIGLRGLKLHPRSDGWSDHITSDEVARVVIEAAKYGLNVIFDTRGFWQLEAIYELTLKVLSMIKNTDIPPSNVKIQPAHVGFHTGHDELYEILAHPNIHGDLSGVHGAGINKLFSEAKEYIPQYTKRKRWSEAILFGSDFNYFDAPHASDVIYYVLSDDFVGDDIDRRNILGYNGIRFNPSYGASLLQKKECASV